jgi:hypothetical protein
VPVAVALDQPTSPVARALTFLRKTLTIAEWEVRKLRHDPTDVLTRTVQPALWLLVFGVTFTRIKAIPTGYSSYMQFLAPGILAQSVLFLAIFYGVAIIWERDLGVIHKFLASPTPRTALVVGKALSAGVRGLPPGRHHLHPGADSRRPDELEPSCPARRRRDRHARRGLLLYLLDHRGLLA